jgi:hypothetical protein
MDGGTGGRGRWRDTANAYGYGTSEEITGRALRKYASREEIVADGERDGAAPVCRRSLAVRGRCRAAPVTRTG